MAAHPPIGDPGRGWGWWTSGSSGTLKVMSIRTIVTADVDQGQAQELVGAFRTLLAGGLPDGLLDTQLLGDGEGHWAIHSLWRDLAALDAMRAASEPPALRLCSVASRRSRHWSSCRSWSTAATHAEHGSVGDRGLSGR